MTDDLKVVETADGSKTLYDVRRDIHYRATQGAVYESRYVFVNGSGLVDKPSPWRVVELGFGAAVNFVQTATALADGRLSADGQRRLEYHAVDFAPVEPELLNFHDGPAGDLARRALREVRRHDEPREVSSTGGQIVLRLYPHRWLKFDRPGLAADAVYFDPFGPRTEPDSWTTDCFRTASRHLDDRGTLATYSAATDVKRAMFEAGLWVGSAPGPGRKREVTFASKDVAVLKARQNIEMLSREKYLANSSD